MIKWKDLSPREQRAIRNLSWLILALIFFLAAIGFLIWTFVLPLEPYASWIKTFIAYILCYTGGVYCHRQVER